MHTAVGAAAVSSKPNEDVSAAGGGATHESFHCASMGPGLDGGDDDEFRRAWVWVHAAAATEALQEMKKACALADAPCRGSCKVHRHESQRCLQRMPMYTDVS